MAILISACVSPISDVTISPLDFGAVEPRHVHHGSVRVTNVGAPTRLLRLEQRSGPKSIVVTPMQVGFGAGDQTTWNVMFTAADEGEVEASFVAVFDTGSTTFTVRAIVSAPCVVDPFDVGDARVGGTVTKTFTVRNPLSRPASLRVGTSSAPFFVEGAGTVRLAAKEARGLTVTFAPDAEGLNERTWLVAPQTDCTPVTTTLRGRALRTPVVFVPGRIRFGTLSAGEETTRTVEVQNRTRSSIRLTAASIASPQFELMTSLPLELPAERSANVTVRARAASLDAHAATLTISTDSPLQREAELVLVMNHDGPCVTVTPDRLDFGSVELDCRSAEASVTITNRCPHALRLASPLLPEGVALTSASARASIAAGTSEPLRLVFAPSSDGLITEPLRLDVDVFDGVERFALPITATASPRSVVEESTVVLNENRRDLLFVIDDSPGMLWGETLVARNLRDFGRYLEGMNYDTRIAVMSTSTTPGVMGRLRRSANGAAWLENPSPAELELHTRVRGEQTGRSSCLEALRAALSPPLSDEPFELGAMLRRDVPLGVMCITNQRDQLEGPAIEAISFIHDRLPRHHEIGVVSRNAEYTWCPGTIEHGPLQALVWSNGWREEFCTPNWAFGPIGRPTFGGGPGLWYLARQPSLLRGPLKVLIDDVEIPPVDPEIQSRIWEWNGAANAVQFEPLYNPEPGRRVTVRYTPDCPR